MVCKSMSIVAVFSGCVLLSVSAGTPAQADVSAHCQDYGFCLFSGAGFTSKKATVPTGSGCRAVATLGFTTARSAARGYGDSKVLELFADAECANSVGTVVTEVANTSAVAYRLMSIPG